MAFKEVLRTLLGSSAQEAPHQQPTPSAQDGGSKHAEEKDGSAAATVDEKDVVAAVSEHTGVPVEKLERVFHLDGGIVKILVNHSGLGNSSADKTRAVAQIITVVRKIGMGHADTSFDIIRAECDRKHFYDVKNW